MSRSKSTLSTLKHDRYAFTSYTTVWNKEHLNHQIHLPGEENQVKQNQAQFVPKIYLNNKLIFTTSFAVFNK